MCVTLCFHTCVSRRFNNPILRQLSHTNQQWHLTTSHQRICCSPFLFLKLNFHSPVFVWGYMYLDISPPRRNYQSTRNTIPSRDALIWSVRTSIPGLARKRQGRMLRFVSGISFGGCEELIVLDSLFLPDLEEMVSSASLLWFKPRLAALGITRPCTICLQGARLSREPLKRSGGSTFTAGNGTPITQWRLHQTETARTGTASGLAGTETCHRPRTLLPIWRWFEGRELSGLLFLPSASRTLMSVTFMVPYRREKIPWG